MKLQQKQYRLPFRHRVATALLEKHDQNKKRGTGRPTCQENEDSRYDSCSSIETNTMQKLTCKMHNSLPKMQYVK